MPRMPTERDYITGMVPREMLADGDPTADNSDVPEGMTVVNEAGLTRVTIPSPPFIPPRAPTELQSNALPTRGAPALTFDFGLLPDVQCHLELRGPATADHLEQLVEYLTVAVRKLREQEGRPKMVRAGKTLKSKNP